MGDRILVPTDGSNRARRAAAQAIDIAARDDAVVHVLHVVSMGDADYVAIPADIAETRAHLERKGGEYVSEVAAMGEEANVEVVTDVRTGTPEREIVEYVADADVDLIVMGKRGRADVERLLVGSTTNRVTGTTDVPVRVV